MSRDALVLMWVALILLGLALYKLDACHNNQKYCEQSQQSCQERADACIVRLAETTARPTKSLPTTCFKGDLIRVRVEGRDAFYICEAEAMAVWREVRKKR